MNISEDEYNQLKKDAARYHFLYNRITYSDFQYTKAVLDWDIGLSSLAPVDLSAAIDHELDRHNKFLNERIKRPN